MKKMKRATALILSAALALSLAACSGGETGSANEPAKDPLVAATEKLAGLKSLDAQTIMEMEISVQGQTVTSKTTMDITSFSDPLKMKIEVTSEAAGASQKASIYAEGEKDAYTIYTSADGTNWAKASATEADLLQYDAKASLVEYLALSSDFKEAGTETLDAGEATKYTGVIGSDGIEAVIGSSGALDTLSSSGITDEQLKTMFKDMKDMPVTLWLDKATGYPVKYDIDMTDVMAAIAKGILTATGQPEDAMAFTKTTISITQSNFDKATDFEIPAEAKAS